MGKRKDSKREALLYESITRLAAGTEPINDDADADDSLTHDTGPISDTVLAASGDFSPLLTSQARPLLKMKKFRFQLLHHWMVTSGTPARVADIGGGKGLLAYLLQQSGWTATVIDPIYQELPTKYKDITTDKRVFIADHERVARITEEFAIPMAQNFDVLVAMHAHGCNLQIIDAAALYGRKFVLLPCCIIQEPLLPPPGTHWLQFVVDYAKQKGFTVEPFRLGFKGQNIGLCRY